MIPVVNYLKEVEVIEQPSLCHRMIFDTGHISGECDGLEAVKQAIYNILNTERYQYIIYSWNYGVELQGLFGMPVDYVAAEAERRITEALMQDDRITAVDNFEFEEGRKKLSVTFTVHTKYGDVQGEKEVEM